MTNSGRPNSKHSKERRRALLLGLAVFLCCGYFFYAGGSWNVGSHYAQVMALAEEHRLAIDTFHRLTGDEAYYQGHYYSDKLLGPSLLAVPVYLAVKPLATALAPSPGLAHMAALALCNALTNALPTALLVALLYLFLTEFGLTAAWRAWLALACGLGTLLLPYATVLFGHNLAAVCAGGAFMLLWRQKREWRLGRALAAGALIGLGAICDFTALFLSAFLGLYAIRIAVAAGGGISNLRSQISRVVVRVIPVAAMALLFIGIQLAANWASFGSPLTFPHVHHVQAAFRERHTHGMLGVHLPQLVPLWQLTFGGHRGLFLSSPFLLFALPGFFLLAKKHRAEAILFGVACLGVVLLSSGYENWEAGSAFGPRYLIPTLPLLIIAVAFAAPRWEFVFKVLAVVSIAFMFIVTAHSVQVPEALPVPLASALGAFSAGQLEQPNLGTAMGLKGLGSLLPLVVVELGVLGALWRSLRQEKVAPAAEKATKRHGQSVGK